MIKGWHFEDISSGGAQVEVVRAPEAGAEAADVELRWQVGATGEAAYRFVVELEGPAGLPLDPQQAPTAGASPARRRTEPYGVIPRARRPLTAP